MKKFSLILFSASMALAAYAAVPTGYYTSCEGKYGKNLLQALEDVVGPHTTISYGGLWDLYKTSDIDANGKIWDMYSTKRWNPGREQCGSYKDIGDCYNREHSLPKSWFDDASPMVSDAFHIYPTDGKVNGQRSNYPFGECKNGSYVASNGGVKALGKLGKSTRSGYSGTVLEPDDMYKGDFARSYFYMAAAYNGRVSSWHSDAMAGNNYPVFKQWTIDMLLEWHRNDPVSDKERNRNEAVYKRQHNRNPFIDHPELAEHIWGNKNSTGWKTGGATTPDPVLAKPAQGASFNLGSTVAGKAISTSVAVAGSDFTQDLAVSISGKGFSVTPAKLSAAQVNGGYTLTVTFKPTAADAGSYSGTLTLSSGKISRSVALSAQVATSITATSPHSVTDNSFYATWLAIHPEAVYKLHVLDGNSELQGFPVNVAAEEQEYEVTGLEPDKTYTYYVEYNGQNSNRVSVTTLGELPLIEFFSDQSLSFITEAGKPSADATVEFTTQNLPDNEIDLKVNAPFELSSDRNRWGRHIRVTDNDDHFYIRVSAQAQPGEYSASVKAQAGDYLNDRLTVEATVSETGAITPAEAFAAGWEAYNLEGSLAVDNRTGLLMVSVYDIEGRTWLYNLQIGTGVTRISLPAGVYIVVAADSARRVIIF